MADVRIQDTTLKSIGNAIRSKTGSDALLLPSEMPDAIASISGGGGGLILPDSSSKVAIYTGSSTEEYVYIDTNIDPTKILQIAFYTSPQGGYRGDYNTGFFYDKNLCKIWEDNWESYNLSLISVGTAVKSRYNYGGYSVDLNNGYNYIYNESSNSSYQHGYCYVNIDPWSGQLYVWYSTSPKGEGYTPTTSDPVIMSPFSYSAPFVITYNK